MLMKYNKIKTKRLSIQFFFNLFYLILLLLLLLLLLLYKRIN
jgi:hypothetical protein